MESIKAVKSLSDKYLKLKAFDKIWYVRYNGQKGNSVALTLTNKTNTNTVQFESDGVKLDYRKDKCDKEQLDLLSFVEKNMIGNFYKNNFKTPKAKSEPKVKEQPKGKSEPKGTKEKIKEAIVTRI